jgi:HEAT repeat protein
MDGSASPTPEQRIAAECAHRGRATLIAGCVALLSGRPDDVDDRLITVLGGDAAAHVLDGGEGGRSGYWPRVWAARGLLHAWDDPTADHTVTAAADPTVAVNDDDAAIGALIRAMDDPVWRVREMAAKVVAAHRIGQALDAVAALRDDPSPRVRAAAERAVVLLTASSAL